MTYANGASHHAMEDHMRTRHHDDTLITGRLLRLPDVSLRLGLRKTAIRVRAADGRLTPPLRLGARCIVWPESEITAITGAIIAGADDEQLREVVTRLVAQRRTRAA